MNSVLQERAQKCIHHILYFTALETDFLNIRNKNIIYKGLCLPHVIFHERKLTSWKKLIKNKSNCSVANSNEFWLIELDGLGQSNTYIISDNQVQLFSPWQQVLKSWTQRYMEQNQNSTACFVRLRWPVSRNPKFLQDFQVSHIISSAFKFN